MIELGELRPLRIVIADDHPVVRAGVKTLLEKQENWTVCGEAGDGQNALDLGDTLMPDIMVLDHSLPIMNGVEVARRIRAHLTSTQVVLHTMHYDDALIKDAFDAGVLGYILKTDDSSRLIDAVKAAMRGQRCVSQPIGDNLLDPAVSGEKLVNGDALTNREREVIQLVAEGGSNGTIAARWGVSIKTVDSHRTAVMRKLHLKTVVDLVRYAIRNRIIPF